MSRSATPATRNEATRCLKPTKSTPSAELTTGTAIRGSRERLRTVADVNATSSEHTLNPQTPRVKLEPLLRIRGKSRVSNFKTTIKSQLFPLNLHSSQNLFFPTCQVRVVRFYLSCLLLLSSSSSPPPLVVLLLSLSSSSSCSTAIRDPQCSLPDLNHDHPRPVFPAGPQPRPSTPSGPCRTSTTTIHAQCSLPDLNPQPRPTNREYPCQSVPCRTSCRKIWDKACAEES